jgi:hypothetical protein
MNIQTLLFEKDKWTPSKARAWLKKHSHKPIKRVHTTEEHHRYRLQNPDKEMYRYRTKKLGDGIKAVFQYPKQTKPKFEKPK